MAQKLADFTTLRLGGPATRVVTAVSTEEVVDLVRTSDVAGEPVLVVGGGSNLVVSDDGWDGLVVLVRTKGIEVIDQPDAAIVVADAGVEWDQLVEMSVEHGWSGLAAMSGIPGLVGGTPIQNVGAYGSEVADVLGRVTVFDRQRAVVESWRAGRCEFGFRTSRFKHSDRWVILDAAFQLPKSPEAAPVNYLELARRLGVGIGETAPSKDVRELVLELRRGKGMVLDPADHDTWSVGSFFVNPLVEPSEVPPDCPHWDFQGRVKLSAAWLIETAGFGKGFGLDREPRTVAVSTKHSLALTNRGAASTRDLLELARVIRAGVHDRFGIRLEPEPRLVGVEL